MEDIRDEGLTPGERLERAVACASLLKQRVDEAAELAAFLGGDGKTRHDSHEDALLWSSNTEEHQAGVLAREIRNILYDVKTSLLCISVRALARAEAVNGPSLPVTRQQAEKSMLAHEKMLSGLNDEIDKEVERLRPPVVPA